MRAYSAHMQQLLICRFTVGEPSRAARQTARVISRICDCDSRHRFDLSWASLMISAYGSLPEYRFIVCVTTRTYSGRIFSNGHERIHSGVAPARHIAVAETLGRDVAVQAPFDRAIHASIVDSLVDWLLVFPRVPGRGREIESLANERLEFRAQPIVTADHAAEIKLLARLRESRDPVAGAGERDLFAGVQAGGERSVGGTDVGHRLSRILQILLSLRIDRDRFAFGEFISFAHAPQASGRGIDDEIDVAGLRVTFAAVVGPTIDFAEAGNFES